MRKIQAETILGRQVESLVYDHIGCDVIFFYSVRSIGGYRLPNQTRQLFNDMDR